MKFHQIFTISLLFHLVSICLVSGEQGEENATASRLSGMSLAELESRADQIKEDLDSLAHFSLRSGVGAIGARTFGGYDPTEQRWIQVTLDEQCYIDQIVLVPAIWRDNKAGFISDSFPSAFHIVVGNDSHPEGKTIASFDNQHDHFLPRIAPFVVPCSIEARWVKLVATKLISRKLDKKFNLELAEIMLFSGSKNVALNQKVTHSSPDAMERGARKKAFAVDGQTPFLMDAGRGEQSIAFIGTCNAKQKPSITLDLGESIPIDGISLHSVDHTDTVPHATPAGFAMPTKIIVEGAQQADFSDATLLTAYSIDSVFKTGPILSQNFPSQGQRYVRVTAEAPYVYQQEDRLRHMLGFAEIEILSNGHNVAAGKIATPEAMHKVPEVRPISKLTDGHNLYGKILSTRDWLNELAQRHDLETELPLVRAAITQRYAQQTLQIQQLIWLVAILIAAIGFTMLTGRMLRMRQASRIKERFAADLHDELGANLHTIGLLSDMAKEAHEAPDKLDKILDRIRVFTERSGTAARHCTNMLEAKGICEDLVDEMTRSSRRLLTDLEYSLDFTGEEVLADLKPRRRIDLFLFFKEALVNVLRHSGATKVQIQLDANKDDITLGIKDNGHGIESNGIEIPASIRRRARLLRAKVAVSHPSEGGTKITLKLKTRTFTLIP